MQARAELFQEQLVIAKKRRTERETIATEPKEGAVIPLVIPVVEEEGAPI